MTEWNPRYLAYCAATGGLDPEATAARDAVAYPGGRMVGFIIWIGQKWAEWHVLKGRVRFQTALTAADHTDFDAWLESH